MGGEKVVGTMCHRCGREFSLEGVETYRALVLGAVKVPKNVAETGKRSPVLVADEPAICLCPPCLNELLDWLQEPGLFPVPEGGN